MTTKVTYRPGRAGQPPMDCPLGECMAFLGGAWTANIIWFLRAGPRRFNELRGDIGGISAKVLSARLQRLSADGIVERHVMPTAPPTVEYELTDLGHELVPAVESIVDVGSRLQQRTLSYS